MGITSNRLVIAFASNTVLPIMPQCPRQYTSYVYSSVYCRSSSAFLSSSVRNLLSLYVLKHTVASLLSMKCFFIQCCMFIGLKLNTICFLVLPPRKRTFNWFISASWHSVASSTHSSVNSPFSNVIDLIFSTSSSPANAISFPFSKHLIRISDSFTLKYLPRFQLLITCFSSGNVDFLFVSPV